MTDIEKLWMEAVTAFVILVAACSITWFAADAHYSKALNNLEGQLQGAGKEQEKAVKATEAHDAEVMREINDAAKKQIATMDAAITDLKLRSATNPRPLKVCTTTTSSVKPYLDPIGPAAPRTDRLPRKSVETTVGLSSGELKDVLTVGIDSLKAELFWRDYARRTGQTSP